MKAYEIGVIGAGFFGLKVALYFAKKRKSIIILESENQAFQRASSINQARIHNGYHYPRSYSTAISSHNHYKRFCTEHSYAVDSSQANIYALAKFNSYTTSHQFKTFCKLVDIPLNKTPSEIRSLFSNDLIEDSYLVEESVFNYNKLKDNLLNELSKYSNVEIKYNAVVNRLDYVNGLFTLNTNSLKYHSEKVFNTTYAGINFLLQNSGFQSLDFRLELAELAFIKLPKELNKIGFTIMDGQFFSSIYFPKLDCHSLSHVRYTPHIEWDEKEYCVNPYRLIEKKHKSKFKHMINDAIRYMPILKKAKYLHSSYTIKAVPVRNEINDGRPIVIKEHLNNKSNLLVSILGSKIDTIYDLERYLDRY